MATTTLTRITTEDDTSFGVSDLTLSKTESIEQVILTTELLEAIFHSFNLYSSEGIRTVIACRRVCREFKRTIDGSPSLQQALFFQAEDTTRDYDGIQPHNPIAAQGVPPLQFMERREGKTYSVQIYSWFVRAQNDRLQSIAVKVKRTEGGTATHDGRNDSWRKMRFLRRPYRVAVVWREVEHNKVDFVNATLGEIYDWACRGTPIRRIPGVGNEA